jgi:prolyl oligopeptidase
VRDPYRWLEDAKSPEVQQWMKAEDDLARSKLNALPDRAAIAARLKEIAYVDEQSPPITRGGRVFSFRRSGQQDKWILYWRQGTNGAEKVLLDPNKWSADGSSSLHDTSVSRDGKRIAYTVSENNADDATLHVMEIATGTESKVDLIPGAKYAHASWTPNGDGFYYVWLPTDPKIPMDQRSGYAEVRFHKLGADPSKDVTVHEKTGDPTKGLEGWITKDGKWLFANIDYGWNRSDVYFREANGKSTEWKPFIVGQDALYNVEWFKGRFYVLTNEGASKYRVFAVDPAHVERTAWKEIVPERADATLESARILGGKLALSYLKDATTRLELRELDGKPFREVTLPGLGAGSLDGDDDRDEAFWGYETFNEPSEIHLTSIARGGDKLWFKVKVPVDSAAYVVEQVFFQSKDGTRVPMFVVHAKNFVKDGTAPAYVSGYGGFNVAVTPHFSNSMFPWIERGGIYVKVNLRGGSEYGEAWHRAGMLHQKQHVFDDFEGAAEALQREKFTSADRTMIIGGSNGGLLVGAAMVQRPDLYRVVICQVPLLDMIRYPRFGTGQTWVEEYGSPEKEEDFKALYAYSPYHHVVPGTRYPSLLMDSADSDDRVDPMHARKFVAEMQAASTGGPVLLRIERHSGHGGADKMSAWVDDTADQLAFTLAEIKKVGGSVSP